MVSSPKHSKIVEFDVDIPEDVVNMILSLLPFKKHRSLSTFSKTYLDSWKSCRNLCFDSDFGKNLPREACRSIINDYFNNHTSTCADVFKLHYDATGEHDLVSSWVHNAIRLGIKELELDLGKVKSNQPIPSLHYELVDVESLRIMRLVHCELYLPLNLNTLRHLTELTLQGVEARQELTESIFVNCVSLRELRLVKCSMHLTVRAFMVDHAKGFKTLVVKDCTEVQEIIIDSPLLRTFHYRGKMTDFRFYTEMQHLSDVILDIAHPRCFVLFTNREELVRGLAFVEILVVSNVFLEAISAIFQNNQYHTIAFSLNRLKEFHLIVAPESFVTPSGVAMFVDRCSIIVKIFIDIGKDALGGGRYWTEYGKVHLGSCEKTFSFLQYVKIKGFAKREGPIHMAKFFLRHAINLHSLILVKARTHHFDKKYNPDNLFTKIIYKPKSKCIALAEIRIQICPNMQELSSDTYDGLSMQQQFRSIEVFVF